MLIGQLVNHLATSPYINNLDIESQEALILAHMPLFNAIFLTLKQQQLQKELEFLKPINLNTLSSSLKIVNSKREEHDFVYPCAVWLVDRAKQDGTLQAYEIYQAKFKKLAYTERLTAQVETIMAIAWPVLTIAVPLITFTFFNPLNLFGLKVILGVATSCLLSVPPLQNCQRAAEAYLRANN